MRWVLVRAPHRLWGLLAMCPSSVVHVSDPLAMPWLPLYPTPPWKRPAPALPCAGHHDRVQIGGGAEGPVAGHREGGWGAVPRPYWLGHPKDPRPTSLSNFSRATSAWEAACNTAPARHRCPPQLAEGARISKFVEKPSLDQHEEMSMSYEQLVDFYEESNVDSVPLEGEGRAVGACRRGGAAVGS